MNVRIIEYLKAAAARGDVEASEILKLALAEAAHTEAVAREATDNPFDERRLDPEIARHLNRPVAISLQVRLPELRRVAKH